MSQKWNLQDIRPVEPRRSKPKPAPGNDLDVSGRKVTPRTVLREEIPSVVIEDGNKKSFSMLIVSIVVFIVVVGGAIVLSALMGKTELTIEPRFRQPNVSASFTAYPERRDGELSYEVLTLEATGESQVKASGQVDVKEQATGVIEIRKSTPGAERLIKNTRFRSKDGLIFKIYESAVVPGAVKDESGALVPGSIRAEVFADEPGEEYNLQKGESFDVPGFEEGGYTALHQAITATNPEPFTGGFNGPQFEIDPSELATARQALQMQLRDTLLARIDNEKAAGFIAFPGSVALTYNQLPAVEYGNELVTIREQAILQIPLFEHIEFGSFLAAQTVTAYDGEDVRVDDPTVLEFSYTGATTSSSIIANEPSLTFRLVGRPLLIWEFDGALLSENVAGLNKTALSNVIEAYPGIESARVRITPFWKRTFPDDPSEIEIIEVVDLDSKE
jgi:hypothetical protein